MTEAELKLVKRKAKAAFKECVGDDHWKMHQFMTTFGKMLRQSVDLEPAE